MNRFSSFCLAGFLLSTGVHADSLAPSGSDDHCFPQKPMAWCLLDLADASAGLSVLSRDQVPKGLYHNGRKLEVIRMGVDGMPVSRQVAALGKPMGIAAVKRDTLKPVPAEADCGFVLVPGSEMNANFREALIRI